MSPLCHICLVVDFQPLQKTFTFDRNYYGILIEEAKGQLDSDPLVARLPNAEQALMSDRVRLRAQSLNRRSHRLTHLHRDTSDPEQFNDRNRWRRYRVS